MFLVVSVKPHFQNTQSMLLLKEQTTLEIAKAAIHGKRLAAVFEGG